MKLFILKGRFTIHRLPPKALLPVFDGEEFFNIVKTSEELSVVCSESIVIDSEKSETGWVVIKIQGPLEFSMTGVLAKLSAILAAAEISIFVISTFDTDYVMVKSKNINLAKKKLTEEGYEF